MRWLLRNAGAQMGAILLAAMGASANTDRSDLHRFAPEPGGEVQGEFLVKFNNVTNCPSWTLERLNYGNFEPHRADRDGLSFNASDNRSKEWRATPADWTGSGYDRGHLAPAANYVSSQGALAATFTCDNCIPQDPALNRGLWADVEQRARTLCWGGRIVYVLTVPVWQVDGDNTVVKAIGERRVWVPSHVGKSILVTDNREVVAYETYLLPNEKPAERRSLQSYRCTINYLEQCARLDLWAALPDAEEDRMEAS